MENNKIVAGIVTKNCTGNIRIETVIRASRSGIARFEQLTDVIEQTQGKVIIDKTALQEGDFVVTIMTAVNETTGKTLREKTTALFPIGLEPVEAGTITLPSGTSVGKDSGVRVA